MSTATETKPRPLTARQAEIYRWVWERTLADGFQPSQEEIAAAFGVTATKAKVTFDDLAHKGWVAMSFRRNRSIKFLYTPDGEPWRGFVHRGGAGA